MSLAVSYNQLQKAVGRYLGYGRNVYGPDDGSDAWADIEDCILSGLRQFYAPPVLANQPAPHHWSFLRPSTVIALNAEVGDYDLPDDFGGICGDLTYPPSTAYRPVVLVSEPALRTLRQNSPRSGYPTHAAVRPKSTDGTAAQIFEIIVWPTPDTDIQLSCRYYVHPVAISHTNPYPYGGEAHAETILESCLAIAEQRLNDEKGLHWEKFQQRLSASIQYDLKTSGPDFLGYNGDDSDGSVFRYDRFDSVTVNGQTID